LAFQSLEEWQEALDKMIFSFEQLISYNYCQEENEKVDEGLKLFKKHWLSLWW